MNETMVVRLGNKITDVRGFEFREPMLWKYTDTGAKQQLPQWVLNETDQNGLYPQKQLQIKQGFAAI